MRPFIFVFLLPLAVLAQSSTNQAVVTVSTSFQLSNSFDNNRQPHTVSIAVPVTITASPTSSAVSSAANSSATGNSTQPSSSSSSNSTSSSATSTSLSPADPSAAGGGGGGANGAPSPGASAAGGIYGPPDSYTSSSFIVHSAAFLVSCIGLIAGVMLI